MESQNTVQLWLSGIHPTSSQQGPNDKISYGASVIPCLSFPGVLQRSPQLVGFATLFSGMYNSTDGIEHFNRGASAVWLRRMIGRSDS